MNNKIALVLEGGGMRGVYTSGVLDYFMDNNIQFPYVIGVSAGACNACSFISNQRGRNKIVNIEYVNDDRYLSYKGLIRNKSIFGMDFIFNEIPNNLTPFDFETFLNSDTTFKVVTTDCDTGKAFYFDKSNYERDFFDIVRASISLPFVAPIATVNNKNLLDGGITDSIPIKKAFEDGYDKAVIVLTRNKGYRKQPFKHRKIASIFYQKYPNLVDAIMNRYKVYNETLDYIEKLEKIGKVIVIRPSHPVNVSRIEKNKDKLNALYDMGYDDTEIISEVLNEFIFDDERILIDA